MGRGASPHGLRRLAKWVEDPHRFEELWPARFGRHRILLRRTCPIVPTLLFNPPYRIGRHVKALLRRAACKLEMEDYKGAISDYEEAQQLEPNDKTIAQASVQHTACAADCGCVRLCVPRDSPCLA